MIPTLMNGNMNDGNSRLHVVNFVNLLSGQLALILVEIYKNLLLLGVFKSYVFVIW